jgi:hypothetical protein
MLGQVMLVMTCYVRLLQVRSGYIRLLMFGKFISS